MSLPTREGMAFLIFRSLLAGGGMDGGLSAVRVDL
jgi:hypothetical protein